MQLTAYYLYIYYKLFIIKGICMIKERIKLLRKTLNLTQSEFGNKLDKKLRTIQSYESGEVQITDGVLLNLQEKFNVNIDWLRTGHGSMFLENKQDKIINKAQIKNVTSINADNNINIPFYTDIEASAGYGAFVGMEEYENVSVSKSVMKVNNNSVIITVTGDSMEPTLYNKDKVVIDTNDRYELKKNKVYVIRKDNELYIKRFSTCINGICIFTSDNTKYESVVINEYDSSSIVGRLKSVIRDFN